MAEIRVTRDFDALKITIGGVLHLRLSRSKLLGVQSWVMSEEAWYFIEYTMVDGVISCDYDSREK